MGNESTVIAFNGDRVTVQGTVEKLTTFASKGGGLNVMVQLPDNPEVGEKMIANRQKICRMTFEFSSVKAVEIESEKKSAELDFDQDGDSGMGGDPEIPAETPKKPRPKRTGKKESYEDELPEAEDKKL